MTEAESQWRAKRLEALTKVAGYPEAIAQGVVEREALWRPWEFIVHRVPALKILNRPGGR